MVDVHPARNSVHYGRLTACQALQRLAFCCSGSTESVLENPPEPIAQPLSLDEVITTLRERWQASYDLQLVVRRRRLYLQVMWAYLEQQSFPLDEPGYRSHLAEVLEIVNRLGEAETVRDWLMTTRDKPRLGKALSLQLQGEGRLEEFLI